MDSIEQIVKDYLCDNVIYEYNNTKTYCNATVGLIGISGLFFGLYNYIRVLEIETDKQNTRSVHTQTDNIMNEKIQSIYDDIENKEEYSSSDNITDKTTSSLFEEVVFF